MERLQYNYTLHEEKAKTAIEEAAQRCDSDPACPKQGDLDQGKVLDALRALAANDEQAVSALDKDTLAFAYYTLRRDPDVRFEILIPDTVKEQAFDWGKIALDLVSPTPTGKAGGAVKATEKVSAEVLEALGRKFGDDLANIDAKGVPELVEGAHSLVGANRAVIDPRKLTDYALNPDHPVGGNKARVFESVLGFTKGNSDLLMKQLQEGVMKNTSIPGKVDQYGARFTVDIPVTGPNGSGVVRSGWIYKLGSNTSELTTIFVK